MLAMMANDNLVRMAALAAVEVGGAVIALAVDVDGLAVGAAETAEDALVLGLDDVVVEEARSLSIGSQAHFVRNDDDIRMTKGLSSFPVALVSKMDLH